MKSPVPTLAALAALFFGPLIIAIVLYGGRDSLGGFGQVRNPDRELIAEPPTVPLEALRLADGTTSDAAWARSRWSLIYARMRACEEECAAALGRLHQVWLALGGERDRMQQVFLAPPSDAETDVPADFLIGILEPTDSSALIDLLGIERLEEGRYFVVDPLGNVILSYPVGADQNRLLKDLERLLDVSRVG